MLRHLLRRLWCKHARTRCIHGDEILAASGGFGRIRRQRCLDCRAALGRGLPAVCTETGAPHGFLVLLNPS